MFLQNMKSTVLAWLNLSCLEAITFVVLLAETLQRLQLDAFVSLSHDALKDAKVKENMIALQNLCQNHNSNTSCSWEQYQGLMEVFTSIQ